MNRIFTLGVGLCLLFPFNGVSGQTKQEIGVRMFSLEQFGLIYKRQLKSGRYLRINTLNLQLTYDSRGLWSAALGGAIGLEQRASLGQQLTFLHGPQLVNQYQYAKSSSDLSSFAVSLGLGYIFGLQYDIAERVFINAETTPVLQLVYNGRPEAPEVAIFQIRASQNTQIIAITLGIRFTR